jgi:hypothetical protein
MCSLTEFQRFLLRACDDLHGNMYVRRLLIPLPRIVGQVALTKMLAIATANLRAQKIFPGKLRQEKQGLMHDLLTGRVPVKIDVVNKEA